MKKTNLAVHFTKFFFFCQTADIKVAGFMPVYYLLARDTSQVSFFFFLHKIEISKQHRFILYTISYIYRVNIDH